MTRDFEDAIRDRMGFTLPDPAIRLDQGVYSFREFRSEQPQTATDGARLLDNEGGPRDVERLTTGEVVYTETTPTTFAADDFVSTLSRYVRSDPQQVFDRLVERSFPEEDLSNLTIARSYDDAIGGLEPEESPQLQKVRSDIQKANDILTRWEGGDPYFPVFWWEEGEAMLDGAHRGAVLLSEIPNEPVKTWVWDASDLV